MLHPDQPLNCLLVEPCFSPHTFWNFRPVCELFGARAMQPPLPLLTAAAIMPQHWRFKLMDLNARPFCQRDWDEADLVCVGGMLPQQRETLALVRRAKRDGKYVVVGGVDASSQPDVYREADARVLGEGEVSIPLWLESWRAGEPNGVFHDPEKPDVTRSPIPRFDLIRFEDYIQVGIQYSRGCPFNCEFCDIIELYGRVPRTKTPEQVVAELDRLYQLGHRGRVDLADDNFIGNKRNVKKLLPAVISWSRKRGYPFYFTTEASMNLADDRELLEMMRDADFRAVFMGIETPDPELLRATQKGVNAVKPIVSRVQTLYEYGIYVAAGFIMGFDGEKAGTDAAMIRCIEDSGINLAMVGLLIALPNTQLTRRLQREGRMIKWLANEGRSTTSQEFVVREGVEVGDHSVAGLNFVTQRDRREILREYLSVLRAVYAPESYMNRVLRTVGMLQLTPKFHPTPRQRLRLLVGLCRVSFRMSLNRETRWPYWRTLLGALRLGPARFNVALRLLAVFVHFHEHVKFVLQSHESGTAITAWANVPAHIGELSPGSAENTPVWDSEVWSREGTSRTRLPDYPR